MTERLNEALKSFKGLKSHETLELIANILKVKASQVVCPDSLNIGWDELFEKSVEYEKKVGETLETAMIKQAFSILVWLDVQKEE